MALRLEIALLNKRIKSSFKAEARFVKRHGWYPTDPYFMHCVDNCSSMRKRLLKELEALGYEYNANMAIEVAYETWQRRENADEYFRKYKLENPDRVYTNLDRYNSGRKLMKGKQP